MIILVGTSHISPESLQRVEEEIEEGPDCVAAELDPTRYASLKSGEKGVYPSVMFRLLAWLQERLGRKTGVLPGEEMLSAVEAGRSKGVDTYLIDQDISETYRDLVGIGFMEKVKLFVSSIFFRSPVPFNLDRVPSYELVEASLNHLKRYSPKVYRLLVEKRNRRMAHALLSLNERYDDILAVLGIGHIPGVKDILEGENVDFRDKTF